MLALSRLQEIAPDLRRVGLSATVEDPAAIAHQLARHPDPCPILQADPGPAPDIQMLVTDDAPPWAGSGAKYAIPAVLEQVKRHKTTLIFHNFWCLQTGSRSSNVSPHYRLFMPMIWMAIRVGKAPVMSCASTS